MEIVISIVAKVAELLVVPIKRQIGYVIDCNTNIQNLKNEVEKLTDAKTLVIHSIEEARRNGEEIEVDVENWLRSVDGVIEGGVVVGDESSKKCFMGWCPDLKIRYRLGKAAKEELTVVVDLQDKGKFDRVSYRAAPLGTIGPVKDYEAFESRNSVLNAIVDALKDGGVNMVGVYGMPGVGKTTLVKKAAEQVKEMPGVGKTTLVKKAAEQVKEGRLFDKVVLAVVSQTPDIRRIQGEIADGLGLRLDAETDRGRASQLCGGLKKVAKVLVILDDIWKELKLEDVGIPLGSDHEGCKILMSSRNEDVLSREMGANKYFKLEVLPESEAWDFFEKMVGVTVKNPSVQLVAAEVAKRCAGLPILLATVARALKNKEEYAWKDALEQLRRFDKDEIADPVYSCLELSYKALRGDETKSLFLLCGQFLTYDSSISDLLKHAIGLDLFKGRSKLEEARNSLRTLVDELKASCLLLEGDRDGRVKMHDVVRRFAISFASREHHVLAVADEFKEWPTNDVLQQCTGISLPFRKIPDLPAILECPNLRSFMLLNKDPSLQTPDNFFREMKELKVLDLTRVNLSPLPSSLQFLENLQTLCLDGCVLEDISIVGELKKLKVLSLISSNIVRLPREIGKLTRLLLLDLSNCERLEVISPDALSSLTRLEDLYMGNSFVKWETEGSSCQRNNACLSELKLLSNLITLDMQITDADNMPKDLFSSFEKLERFRIFIGDGWDWSVKDATSRTLKLKLNTVIQLEEGVNTLLKITEELHLQELNGVKSILNDLDGEGFRQLRHLHVQNCPGVQYISNSIRMGPRTAFLNLDSLFLENLDNLEKICHGQLMAESLGNLRILKVESCHRLKNLFSVSMARRLVRLEDITIIDCKIMEEVVAEESENDAADGEPIEFTQLRRLTLQRLPQFTSFHSNVEESSDSQRRQKLVASDARSKEIVAGNELGTSTSLFNTRILLPNLEDLLLSSIKVEKIWHDQPSVQPPCVKNLASIAVESCSNLNYLLTSSMVESLAQLERLEICNCESMEEIVVPEGIGEGKMMSKMLFPKLLSIVLVCLPKLTRFCTSNLLECHSLKVLMVGNCPELKEFVSIPSSADVPAMSKPDNTKSALFDDKVAFPDLEEFRIAEMDNLKVIWHNELHSDSFCKLKILHVGHGKNLLNIFPSSMLRRFHNLENLIINDCDSVEEIFDLQVLINVEQRLAVTATPLRVVRLWNLPHLKHVWNRDPQGILSFNNLSTVHVRGCPGLRSLSPASIALNLLQPNGVKSILNDLDGEGFPQLKHLHVQNCPGIQYVINSIRMGPRTAFLNLDSLLLENLDNLEKICHGQLMAESLGNLRILKVESCHRLKNLFSVSMARRLVRIEEITIIDCKIMEEVVAEESENDAADGEPIEFTQLRRLTLQCLPQFTSFHSNVEESSDSQSRQKLLASEARSKEIVAGNELGTSVSLFNTKILFPNLEDLKLSSIKVEKIWHDQPAVQAPCVKNLASIAVENCSNLNYIVASSMVESLAQLKRLEICNCKSMEEIVVPEGIGEGKMMSKMLFPKLLILSLIRLPKLTRFCTSNLLECHSLKVLTVGNCPELKEFISIPSSADVPVMSKPDNTKSALFDDKVAFPDLEEFLIAEMDNLKVIWHSELHSDSFCKLKTLHVVLVKNLLNIFPSSMLRRFHNLENLIINGCDSVEEIFDLQVLINVERRLAVTASQLRVVRLTNLPHLKHVWNRDPEGILSFHNLCTVHVQGCLGLRSLFPASIALNLLQLEELLIVNCGVEEIVAKDEGLEEGPDFLFPKVTYLHLVEVPELKRFYPGIHTSEWPRLKKFWVYHCKKIEIFPSEIKFSHEPCREDHMDIEGQQPLLSFRKIFPNLEDLYLESKDASALLKSLCPQDFYYKLKVLNLVCFHGAHATFPIDLLPRFPKLEKLIAGCSEFKEFLPSRLDAMEKHARVLSPIRHLELDTLPCLEHLWKSNSQLDQALQTLETLVVQKCGSLIYLAPSHASFQNLTNLDVRNCKRLVKLVTSTTAKSLAQLTRMSIKDCGMVTEIVANEGDGIKDEIVFSKLEILELHRLPSLTSFCSEKHSFDFPSLVEVTVKQCPEMKFFSNEALSTPKLRRVKLTEEDKKGSWVGNLNTTIQLLSTQTEAQIAESSSSRYMLAPSMGSIPVQLLELVKGCPEIEEIVTNDLPGAVDLLRELMGHLNHG